MRYNTVTDYIQCLYNETWENAVYAGVQALYAHGNISQTIGNIVAIGSNAGNGQLSAIRPALALESDKFVVSLQNGNKYSGGWARGENKIDLTNFTQFHILLDATANASPLTSTQDVYAFVSSNDNMAAAVNYEIVHGYPAAQTVTNKEIVLDIAALTGFYFIGIYLQTNINAQGNVNATVYKMWLTK